MQVRYFKNSPPIGSPGNWNRALDRASGNFLMLVHQDDWFKTPDAISKYVAAFDEHPHADFVFCRSMAFEQTDPGLVTNHKKILENLASHPEGLLLGNIIGPPSNVMVRQRVTTRYALPFVWLVDVEYYIQLFKQGFKHFFIDEPLVLIGLHDEQMTKYVEQHPEIILKEHLLLATELDPKIFSDWRIYDQYWRLVRNHEVRSTQQLKDLGIDVEKLPGCILRMIDFQKKIPGAFLKNGPLSKSLMLLSKWLHQ